MVEQCCLKLLHRFYYSDPIIRFGFLDVVSNAFVICKWVELSVRAIFYKNLELNLSLQSIVCFSSFNFYLHVSQLHSSVILSIHTFVWTVFKVFFLAFSKHQTNNAFFIPDLGSNSSIKNFFGVSPLRIQKKVPKILETLLKQNVLMYKLQFKLPRHWLTGHFWIAYQVKLVLRFLLYTQRPSEFFKMLRRFNIFRFLLVFTTFGYEKHFKLIA